MPRNSFLKLFLDQGYGSKTPPVYLAKWTPNLSRSSPRKAPFSFVPLQNNTDYFVRRFFGGQSPAVRDSEWALWRLFFLQKNLACWIFFALLKNCNGFTGKENNEVLFELLENYLFSTLFIPADLWNCKFDVFSTNKWYLWLSILG